jgi:hypothetical protein
VFKLGIFLLSLSGPAGAQYVVSAQAGSIQFVVGNVYVDGQGLHKAPLAFPVLKDQQGLRTGRGRVEVLLAPGVFLRLGQQSALRMLDNRLENTVLDIQKGRALVEVVELLKDDHIQIQCGDARTEFTKAGLYGFDADAGVLQVFAGEADVAAAGQQITAGRNRRVSLKGTITASAFRRGNVDALYKWAALRSFNLFLENRTSGGVSKPTNWVYTALGWFWNPDYGAQIAATGSMMKYLPPERGPR